MKIKRGFVLAAGLGTRMRHLTANCPKPLIKVNGKTMLDYMLDELIKAGVEEVVVNTHYFPEMVEAAVKARKDVKITTIYEPELLETGGGVKNAIELFDDEPFYVLNSDVLWIDEGKSCLQDLAEHWSDADMDLLLLLHSFKTAHFNDGDVADYLLEGEFGKPIMTKFGRSDKVGTHIVAGPRIVHPRLFDGYPEGKSSFRDLFIKAEDIGRLYGLNHKGKWFHVGTPEALEETAKIFAEENR